MDLFSILVHFFLAMFFGRVKELLVNLLVMGLLLKDLMGDQFLGSLLLIHAWVKPL